MNKRGIGTLMSVAVLATAGCNNPPANAPTSKVATATSVATGPAKPTATADDNVWGNYLAAQGKAHGKDIQGHPYIYLIPGGDSTAAIARRKEEAKSIGFSVGPVVIPGSLLVLGGPDAAQTNSFAAALPATIKSHALKDVVVLIVSDATQKEALTKAYEPTDATLRFVAM